MTLVRKIKKSTLIKLKSNMNINTQIKIIMRKILMTERKEIILKN